MEIFDWNAVFFAPKRYVDISGYNHKTYDQVKKVIAEEIARLTGLKPKASSLPWARFFGWDPELILDLPTLSADFLDKEFSSTFPIAIVGESGHVAWVNNKAFEVSCITAWISLCLSIDNFLRRYEISTHYSWKKQLLNLLVTQGPLTPFPINQSFIHT